MPAQLNRRRFVRYRVEPTYTPVLIRIGSEGPFDIDGHAYDISEGGVRFEADRIMQPGTEIEMQITLPAAAQDDIGPGRSILVSARVLWIEDEEDPPPVRTAAVFTRFVKACDRERLIRQFASGCYRLVA